MSDSIRVSHISTYSFGGAAFAARRLHEGLLEQQVESRFWYSPKSPNPVSKSTYDIMPLQPESDSKLLAPIKLNIKRMQRKRARRDWRLHLDQRPEGYEVFSAARQFNDSYFDIRELDCDVLNLHWVAFLCDYPSFFASIPHRMPVVWTLHDMNPFTGGCHYAGECQRFQSGCGTCQQVNNPKPDDVSRYGFQLKRRSMRSRKIHVVTPSRWLGQLAQQSPIWPKHTTFSVIPYGLELDQYRPLDRDQARRELGLESKSFVLAFGAEDVANRRKGMSLLIEALKDLPPTEGWEALVFGGGELPEDFPSWVRVKQVGFLDGIHDKARVYSAADIFVMPSIEDNQPQTGLESLACGTGVIGFDATGVPEYVRHLETGMLARVGDTADLGRQILHAANEADLCARLGSNGRQMMEREFPLSLQAQRYLDLYKSVGGHQRREMPKAA